MVGKFLLGMVSGGLVVTGGLVMGSMLFPTGPANDNRAAAPVEEPITAPEATVADAGDTAAKPETPAAEAEAPAPEAVAEPEPAPAEEPVLTPAEPAPAEPATTEPVAETVEPAPETAETGAAETPLEPTPVEPAAEPTPVEPAAEAASQPVVTDVAPAPEAQQSEAAETEDTAPAAGDVPAPETLAEPSKPAETTADVAAVTPEPAEPQPQPATEPAVADATPDPAPEVAAPDPAPTETAVAEPAAPATPEPAAETVAPVTDPVTEAPAENAPAETEIAEAQPELAPQPLPEPVPEPVPEPAADPLPAAEAPAVEPAPEAPAEIMPAAPEVEVAEAAPDAVVPDMPGAKPEALPDLAEAEVTPDAPLTEEGQGSTFKPAPGLTRAGEGVIIGRGTDQDPAPTDAAATPADTRPIVAFAAPFENPDAKPAFAIVLIDDGRADLDRAGLAALPIPASIAVDPLDPATSERAAAYRAAGKEVVMLVTGIAEGAQASDVEVAFQSMAQGLPEAVAVMDLAAPAFQNNRGLASAVVPILKAQGRGLLTWDAGLNAADQVARREDLEAAVVFRNISEAQGDSADVRRHLDRAVFKAGQDGRVAVVGTADPATLAALLEWTVEGKAATVALAPLTAVLKVD